MDKFDEFYKKTKDFISYMLSHTKFDPEDKQYFQKVREAYKLNDHMYDIYAFNTLTSFKPNKNDDSYIVYHFFLLKPEASRKETFLKEIVKKPEDKDMNIISEYYSDLKPKENEFEKLLGVLEEIASKNLFPGRQDTFEFSLGTPTMAFDLVLVFIERSSFKTCLDKYTKNAVFDPAQF